MILTWWTWKVHHTWVLQFYEYFKFLFDILWLTFYFPLLSTLGKSKIGNQIKQFKIFKNKVIGWGWGWRGGFYFLTLWEYGWQISWFSVRDSLITKMVTLSWLSLCVSELQCTAPSKLFCIQRAIVTTHSWGWVWKRCPQIPEF